jgi:hypothetical protein
MLHVFLVWLWILRLVYEKLATTLTRDENIVQKRILKEAQFCADFKTAQNSCVKRKGNFFPKNWFLGTKTFGTSWLKTYVLYWNQREIISIKDGATFSWGQKRSNKIETVHYFTKRFFIN